MDDSANSNSLSPMLALYPARHLAPGERPRDWMDPELALLELWARG
jgi:hypothetical protein